MTEIIAIVNQKGGVGKTTTAINVSACLASAGRKTLLMDADQQGSSTISLGLNKQQLDTTFFDFIMTDDPLDQLVKETMISGFHVLPANDDLIGVDHKIFSLPEREILLRRRMNQKLAALEREGYDFIIIDSPPNLDILTINIMSAADRIIIPTKPDYLSMDGLAKFIETYKRILATTNTKLSILGVLITMNLANCKLSREASQDLRRVFGSLVFENVIPQNIRLAEAPGHSLPILLYDRASAGAASYLAVTQEILNRLKPKK